MVAELAGQEEQEQSRSGRSPTSDAIREFRRNKVAVVGAIFVVAIMLTSILAPLITPYNFATQNVTNSRAAPMTGYIITTEFAEKNCHWYGTPLETGCTIFLVGSDSLGRDLWSRMIYGSRVSLAVAIVAATVSLIIGTTYGIISGYAGGNTDNFMMRIVDFLYALPTLPIIILLTFYFQQIGRRGDEAGGFTNFLIEINRSMGGLFFIFVVIGALFWLGMARLARGQVLSYKQQEFVQAAEAMGASDSRILFRHLLPNIIGPLLVAESLAIPGYIFLEAFLSFIGLGVQPPRPSWGAMINDGYQGLRSAPWLVLVPGMALMLTTLAFNFMGDGLRDAFDVRLRGR